ncbi:MAG TPA: N-acetyltransferase [Candidatus Coatesbacteria bacterium]|nr:N-acetyltransferase [Candidatus Coatesbacteria bacterium]
MKRLFVKPAYRGPDAGRRLAGEIIARAREAGYRNLRLDTVPAVTGAAILYRSFYFLRDYHQPSNL